MLTEKQQYWQSIIEQWKQSGLSQIEFCRNNQLKPQTFYAYRTLFKKREEPPATPAGFIRLEDPSSRPVPLLEIQIGPAVVRLNECTDMALATRWIRQLLQAVPHDSSV